MTFYVENETENVPNYDVEELVRLIATTTLDMEKCPYEVEISVLLTNNESIKELNKEQRNIDKPTDVLSFPNVEFDQPSDFSVVTDQAIDCFEPETGELILGDIVISMDKVAEQAEAYGHSEKREFSFLVAHSMLHLCGYDHMEKAEAAVMEKKQNEILEKLGITREI